MLISEIRTLEELQYLPSDSFYVTVNGRIVDWRTLNGTSKFDVHFRLRGGKGGFGSLLRSFRIHRSTNQLMCRDLSGRRLADVKEEEKLRKWIEKAGERNLEKRRKQREKYEKLKAGPPKHEFNDPDYIRMREKLLDEADDAFDAGMTSVSDKKGTGESGSKKAILSNSESEEDDPSLPGPSRRAVKRKREVKIFKRKVFHFDEEITSPPATAHGKENITPSPPVVSSDADNFKSGSVADEMRDQHSVVGGAHEKAFVKSDVEDSKIEVTTHVEQQVNESKEAQGFSEVDLDEFQNADSLQPLGLDQLKQALEVRGLKCGGSLAERATRLFSVKGLKPEDYPKSVKAVPQKKKGGSKK